MTGKRNLFAEIMDGVGAMQAQREGKITLRTIEVPRLHRLRVPDYARLGLATATGATPVEIESARSSGRHGWRDTQSRRRM